MASCKKPTYKVEIKPINERKRRKSDLVIMWQSIWDLSLYVVLKCWYISTRIWELTNVWMKADEQREIQAWLEKHLPISPPEDFSTSWRDGVLLGILLNQLQPGCYPDAENLDIDYGLRNVYRAFNVLEARFNIVPKVSVEEIVTCSYGSDVKLQELLLQIKNETENKFTDDKKKEQKREHSQDIESQIAYDSNSCIAKGTGLLVGFVGHDAKFVVFYTSMSELDLVVEVRGPLNSICSERITKRSPKRKQSVRLWKPSLLNSVARSLSENNNPSVSVYDDQSIKSESERRDIPVKYEIHTNHINISYTPFVKGQHKVSILYHGQHISDSPYVVTVEPAVGTYRNTNPCLKSVLKHPSTLQVSKAMDSIKKESVRFQEPEEIECKKVGKVVKRRVLRYIVKINKKDIVVDADGIDHLAPALLKMDYDLQKRPLSRRNSWGFVGDAERKVSMIRQFCVDLDQLEAQSMKMHRSHSLSINSRVKRHFPKSSSYECEDIIGSPKLETVTEGKGFDSKVSPLKHNEEDDNDEVFAILNEEFDSKEDDDDETLLIEANCEPETSKESESTEDPVLDITLMKHSGQISDRFALETSKQDLLKSQDSKTSEESFDVLVLEREFSDSGELNPVSNGASESEFSLNIANENHQSNSVINHRNLEEGIIFMNNQLCLDIDKNKKDLRSKIQDYSVTRIESVSNYDIFSDSKNSKPILIDEKPFTKTDAKNVQSSSYVYGEQISPSILKLNRSEKENNTTYSTSEVSNVFNFKVNKNIMADKASSDKAREELNSSERNASLRPDNKLSSFIGTKRRKNNFQKIKKNQYKTPKYDTIFTNLKHFSLTNDTKDNNFKSEYQEVKCARDSSKYSQNIEAYPPEGCCLDSKQMFPTFDHVLSETLSINSNVKTGDKAQDTRASENAVTALRRISDSSIKNNEIRMKTENILSRVHSKPRKEYQSSKIPWNVYSSTNGCHSSTETNINKASCIFDKKTTNNNVEKVPKQKSASDRVPNGNGESFKNNFSIQKRTLVSLGQFNFKHFNPAAQSNRNGPVQARIKQWQSTNNDKSPAPKVTLKFETLPEKGSLTEKLRFWESVQMKHDRVASSGEQTNSQYGAGQNASINLKQKDEREGYAESEASYSIPFNRPGTDDCLKFEANSSVDSDAKSKLKETLCFQINDNNDSWEKQNGDKLSIPQTATRIRKRSFSDPGDLETSRKVNGSAVSEHVEILPELSREILSSSSDANYLELFADDEISSVDLLYSTEDEYIDDEISESASTYWGDISFIKNLKLMDSASYREFCSLIDFEHSKDLKENLPSCPFECKVFGIANYFGHVAIKNRFRVLTNGAGLGNLSATVQGLGQHEVSFVSVEYVRKDVYEVTYQVLTPGLYLISVRWMENSISGSPFLCKVTF